MKMKLQLALIRHDSEHDDQFLTALEKPCQREFSHYFMPRSEGEALLLSSRDSR